jgi:hypothetical protein
MEFSYQELRKQIAERFESLLPTFTKKDGDYIYGERRTSPDDVAYYMLNHMFGVTGHCQILELDWDMPSDVSSGKYDEAIKDKWHDRASAEHWYTYEKEWV